MLLEGCQSSPQTHEPHDLEPLERSSAPRDSIRALPLAALKTLVCAPGAVPASHRQFFKSLPSEEELQIEKEVRGKRIGSWHLTTGMAKSLRTSAWLSL